MSPLPEGCEDLVQEEKKNETTKKMREREKKKKKNVTISKKYYICNQTIKQLLQSYQYEQILIFITIR